MKDNIIITKNNKSIEKDIDFKKYYYLPYNGFNEMFHEPPFIGYITAQFRNVSTGAVRLFTRNVLNRKILSGKELDDFMCECVKKFIDEKTRSTDYEFIPYEAAIYDFPNFGKPITYRAKVFYDDKEKEANDMYYKLALDKYYMEMEKYGRYIGA